MIWSLLGFHLSITIMYTILVGCVNLGATFQGSSSRGPQASGTRVICVGTGSLTALAFQKRVIK